MQCVIDLSVCRVLEGHGNQISAGFMRKVITIADKETKLIEFETFESVQNNVDKGWINFLELGYFWAVVYPLLVVLSGVSGQEGLMPLELFEELIYS